MDSDLKRRVELFLQKKGVVSLPRINIEVEGGKVKLQGTVHSFYERQLYLCCQHVAGVLRVVDELKVCVGPPKSQSAGSFEGIPIASSFILPADDQDRDTR